MTPSRRRAAKLAVLLLAVVAVGVFLSMGADRPPDPSLLPAAGSRRPVEGFGETGFRIEGPEAEAAAARCALLAATSTQHNRGLMQRRDLSGYDGMLFDFKEPVSSQFYMKDTPLPLSIAWFDATGQFVSARDMEPCLDQPSCPTYAAAGPYRWALEVRQGGLPALGAGPGSRLVVTPACT